MTENKTQNSSTRNKKRLVFAVVEGVFLLVVLALLIYVGLGKITNTGNGSDMRGLETEKLYIVKQDGTRHLFEVEVANTTETRRTGLMFRTAMEPDKGMLFVFPRVAEQHFWMRNTYIPLDMIFIREDGRIHRIHENAEPEDLTQIPSRGAVQAVLELNGGRSQEVGIQPGDQIHHKVFRNELAE